MHDAVDAVLDRRSRLAARRRRWPAVVASIAVHVGGALAAVLAPMLAARSEPPPRYVAVQLVPAAALGVRDPAPPAPRPARDENRPRLEGTVTPAPEPEPERPRPQPSPEPRAETPPPLPAETPPPTDDRSPPAPGRAPSEGAADAGGTPDRRGTPEGSARGTSPFGAAVAGLEDPDFTHGYYIDQMLGMIRSRWTRPPIGGEIEATIHFRIHSDGSLSDVRIARSSGYNQFDLAGLRAVRSAAPLPPLPRSYRHDSLGVNLIFR